MQIATVSINVAIMFYTTNAYNTQTHVAAGAHRPNITVQIDVRCLLTMHCDKRYQLTQKIKKK